MFNKLSNLFVSNACALCNFYPASPPYVLCTQCHKELPWLREYINVAQDDLQLSVRCAFYYQWPVDRVLHFFKFQERLEGLNILTHGAHFIPAPNVQALLPVPISQQRLCKRGFNQSLLIAKKLSKIWNIPIWQGVTRVRDTPHQRELKRSQRQNNLFEAFALSTADIPSSIAIVDDVLTTGATLIEIAKLLKQEHPTSSIEGFALSYQPLQLLEDDPN